MDNKEDGMLRVLLLALLLISAAMSQLDPEIEAEELKVTAVQGDRTSFPCNLTSPLQDDQVYLVLWYRASSGRPIYTFDARRGSLVTGVHGAYSTSFKRRSRFLVLTEPPSLIVSDVRKDDEDTYTCRVEYRHAPTGYTKTHLNVIVPPEKIELLDGRGRRVMGTLGPYEEGARVKLTCMATGGDPSPTVTWWRGGEIVDQSSTPVAGESVRNDLWLEQLTRDDLGAVLTCQATNNHLTLPLTAKAKLDMRLRPLMVKISTERSVLSAGKTYAIVCETRGARPAATMSWWKDGERITQATQNSPSRNVSRSILMLMPNREDDGKELRCQTEGYTETLRDKWRLSVRYAPAVRASIVRPLSGNNVSVGDGLLVQCKVAAKPPSGNVYWLFNEKKLSKAPGMKLTNKSLVIMNMTREHSGEYQCMASNEEGTGYSQRINVKVKYSPRCKVNNSSVVSVSLGETISLSCDVESEPLSKNYEWIFNETMPISHKYSKKASAANILSYTPIKEEDYGVIECWASNSVGRQHNPCTFHIEKTETPEAPKNCSQIQEKHGTLRVSCMEGFNGGAKQTFHLLLKHIPTERVTLNLSNSQPQFSLENVDPNEDWVVSVYASNSQGDGPPRKIILDSQILQSISHPPTVETSKSPTVFILISCLLVIVLLAFGVCIFLRFRLPCTCMSKRKKKAPTTTVIKLNSAIPELDNTIGKVLNDDVKLSKGSNADLELRIITEKKKNKKPKKDKNKDVCVMMKILPDDSSLIYPDYEDPDELCPWKFNTLPNKKSPYTRRHPKKNSQSVTNIPSIDPVYNYEIDAAVPEIEKYLAEKLRHHDFCLNIRRDSVETDEIDDDEDFKLPIPEESSHSSLYRDKTRQTLCHSENPFRHSSLQTIPHSNPHRTFRRGVEYKPVQYRSGSYSLIEGQGSPEDEVCMLPMNKRTSISCGYVPSPNSPKYLCAKWDQIRSSSSSSIQTVIPCQDRAIFDGKNTVV